MGDATVAAIVGRTVVGVVMHASADRRLVACVSYAVQIVGSLTFLLAGETNVALMIVGVILLQASTMPHPCRHSSHRLNSRNPTSPGSSR